jgi:hypothetical protein
MLKEDVILCVVREPFLDKIPSLKTLLWYLSDSYKIIIISTKGAKYSSPTFCNKNIRIRLVNLRSKVLDVPTSIKILFEFLKIYTKNKPKICIGGDTYGNLLLRFLNIFFPFKHVFFMLEFPQILTPTHKKLSRVEKKENSILKKVQMIITHDEFHKQFLVNNLKLNPRIIVILPNSTLTEIPSYHSNYLQKKLNISGDKYVILHSGGLGMWFKSKELAESTGNWPENFVLVFHTSHKVEDDKYFKGLRNLDYKKKVLFSTYPVSTFELDELICSAKIGIAMYSREVLGYRADLLGLAAGKIGNYLKCGLPVIATKLQSFSYIPEYKCGILVENESEIPGAIMTIINNYTEFSNNAVSCYEEIWKPTRYFEKIKDLLDSF